MSTRRFLQDVHQPIDNLTFRHGLRYDRSIMRNNFNEAAVDFGARAALYVIWDPFGDGKTKVAGGYGRFNGIGNLRTPPTSTSPTVSARSCSLGEPWNNYTNSTSFNYSLNPPDNTNTARRAYYAAPDEFSFRR
ncbi:MAG: hypothetical protein IPN01_16240 [Deltaproteobacteria bacterium]|nr:hypothetical protein [Deltaproteobacteria bacterium]